MTEIIQRPCMRFSIILGGLLFMGAGCNDDVFSESDEPARSASLVDCPEFADAYGSCEQLAGDLPQFFSSVEIETRSDHFRFITATEQGPLETEYTPDRVVRLGSDYHVSSDGTVLPDLPALESSFCEDRLLVRSEVTVLPDQSLAEEEITMQVGENGELLFLLVVNGMEVLEASCTE